MIVIGFFGFGKIILLCYILDYVDGCRIVVIVNEFGELGIDGDILRGCIIGCDEEGGEKSGILYEFVNGCLCCMV